MFKQLKYFQSVVRLNSFSEAAEGNYISQSAISQQIQALEQFDAVLTHFLVINDQALARCAAQPEVFADTAFRNRR